MLVNISEFRNGTRALGYRFNKRDAFFNIGGVDKTQLIKGDHNRIMVTTDNPTTDGKETLLRKSAHEIGRILESGADLADAPAQWLKFIQQNWYELHQSISAHVNPLWKLNRCGIFV